MLLDSPQEYQQYFTPFSFDSQTIRSILSQRVADQYWGIWVADALAAFFMLRGFDAGYEIPSFGVSVSHRFSRRRLLRLSVSFAIAWCRLNDVTTLMLKVHLNNTVAKREYERWGFRQSQTESPGQTVYRLQLDSTDT